jgi:Rad3-related DNA helicase
MSLLLDIAPADLGLPSKFIRFRETQAEALDFILASSSRWTGGNLPTGTGKGLLGVSVAKVQDAKAVYLTSTKALQEQMMAEFGSIGMTDIRGRANYPCRVYTTKRGDPVSCEEGARQGCKFLNTLGCPYGAAYEEAKKAQLVSTNYAYWLHARANNKKALEVTGECPEPVELLICDEAHNAMEELSGFLAIRLSNGEYEAMGKVEGDGLMDEESGQMWKRWAEDRCEEIRPELEALLMYPRDTLSYIERSRLEELEALKRKLDRIAVMDNGWTWEASEDGVAFDCIWPGNYAGYLWSGVSKVLLMSATLYPYTMKLLGLDKGEFEFQTFSNGWPPQRAPVYYLPTVKLNYKSTDDNYRTLVNRIDEIIDARSDRKGIIHTVSYGRMRKLMEFSRHTRIMFWNDTANDSYRVAERFRQARPPAVLVSPSFGTGWDFAYDSCEYQIVPKTPYPFAESRVMRERVNDSDYRSYCALLDLEQMIGRSRRAPDDRCETFVLDKTLPLLLSKARRFGCKLKIHSILALPKRPEKLTM